MGCFILDEGLPRLSFLELAVRIKEVVLRHLNGALLSSRTHFLTPFYTRTIV
jgi:hypothetical protein